MANIDEQYLRFSVQEALLTLTKAGVIHWTEENEGRLVDFEAELEGKSTPPAVHPCYVAIVRFQVGNLEAEKIVQKENELPEFEVQSPALRVYVDDFSDPELGEPGIMLDSIDLKPVAEAQRECREYRELLTRLGKLIESRKEK